MQAVSHDRCGSSGPGGDMAGSRLAETPNGREGKRQCLGKKWLRSTFWMGACFLDSSVIGAGGQWKTVVLAACVMRARSGIVAARQARVALFALTAHRFADTWNRSALDALVSECMRSSSALLRMTRPTGFAPWAHQSPQGSRPLHFHSPAHEFLHNAQRLVGLGN